MIVSEKKEVDLLIQLEAAKSSLSSTISLLIESMINKKSEDKVELNNTQIKAILRIVKKT